MGRKIEHISYLLSEGFKCNDYRKSKTSMFDSLQSHNCYTKLWYIFITSP